VLSPAWIPIYYSVAMGGDAVAALLMGPWYDRVGLRVMVVGALVTASSAPFAFSGQAVPALVGVVAWSVGLGAQESVLRAAVAGMVGPARRATAGIFNAGFGLAYFAGSVSLGLLYDLSIAAMVAFALVIQLAAAPLFLLAARGQRGRRAV
jgi:MFS family permease